MKLSFKEFKDCRALALKRFVMLAKRLVLGPELQAQYVEFLREYEVLRHCHEVYESDDPPNQPAYCMLHHAVLRPSTTSTKCRVAFNVSAKRSLTELSERSATNRLDLHSSSCDSRSSK